MRKLAFVVLAVFGLVSISVGAYIPEKDEANYQKLKAEMEEAESGFYERWQITCSWGEDGKVVIGDKGHNVFVKDWCGLKNVLAFFDEIRAIEVKTKNRLDSPFSIAIAKVREMPRFKEDSGIYLRTRKISANEAILGNSFWVSVFEEWKETKLKIVMEKNGI